MLPALEYFKVRDFTSELDRMINRIKKKLNFMRQLGDLKHYNLRLFIAVLSSTWNIIYGRSKLYVALP